MDNQTPNTAMLAWKLLTVVNGAGLELFACTSWMTCSDTQTTNPFQQKLARMITCNVHVLSLTYASLPLLRRSAGRECRGNYCAVNGYVTQRDVCFDFHCYGGKNRICVVINTQ